MVTPNPEIVMLARGDTVLSSILNSAEFSLPDGVGLIWASRWQAMWNSFAGPAGSFPITSRVSGVDIMEKLVELASKRGWKVFLLGGKDDVAEAATKKLISKYPKLRVQFAPGPIMNLDGVPVNEAEVKKEQWVIARINEFMPHLLFVGLGFPKQEKWSARNKEKLKANGIMVVGGSFDFISGRVPRAPKFMREVGLEWLFRLVIQPWRIKRQMALPKFIWAVLTSK